MPDNMISNKPYLLVVGSSNTDMVIKTARLPRPGETILGGRFFMNAGGKGANQAVAAARLGANVVFVCKTGDDMFGREAIQLFQKEGIDTRHALTDTAHPSGVALITVDDAGENCIAVASGANAALLPADFANASDLIAGAAFVLMQLEVPTETVLHVAAIAAAANVPVMLNPAPAASLPAELLAHVSIITPNETEAAMLTGIDVRDRSDAEKAARILQGRGIDTVIVTLGPDGALILHRDEFTHVPAQKVKAVDTTAAGDIFNGALAVALISGESIAQAVAFACQAAAISVTRMGAQASAPYIHEIK